MVVPGCLHVVFVGRVTLLGAVCRLVGSLSCVELLSLQSLVCKWSDPLRFFLIRCLGHVRSSGSVIGRGYTGLVFMCMSHLMVRLLMIM